MVKSSNSFPTKLVTKEEGQSSLDTGEGIVSKYKPKKRKKKGGVRRRRKRKKPASKDKAIKAAMDKKGDFLTMKESEDTIKEFEKESKIKKPKKKKKRKTMTKKVKPKKRRSRGRRGGR